MESKSLRLDEMRQRLLDEFQRGLPLVPRPFEEMGKALGSNEAKVLQELKTLSEAGIVSRVGPVFAPNRLGSSTLAALNVPSCDLESVAALVSAYDEVNHNYERDHDFNLWFVITASDRGRIDAVLEDISLRTGLEPLDLPMIEDYFIDLGFKLWS